MKILNDSIFNQQIIKSLNQQIKNCGESRIRTYEGISQQIYSLPQLATLVSPQCTFRLILPAPKYHSSATSTAQKELKNKSRWRDSNPRPADYKSAALAN
jgi:hypothetical protein